jgi:hypothetical protein
MYRATGRERLIPISPTLPVANIGAPTPTVAMVEGTVAVAYDDRNGDRVLVQFQRVNSVLFGAPNDEAFHGHALYGAGLQAYEFVEVENSPWIDDLERMNRVHERHSPEAFARFRHFILPFHDSTFECVARSVEVLPSDSDNPLVVAAIMIDPDK